MTPDSVFLARIRARTAPFFRPTPPSVVASTSDCPGKSRFRARQRPGPTPTPANLSKRRFSNISATDAPDRKRDESRLRATATRRDRRRFLRHRPGFRDVHFPGRSPLGQGAGRAFGRMPGAIESRTDMNAAHPGPAPGPASVRAARAASRMRLRPPAFDPVRATQRCTIPTQPEPDPTYREHPGDAAAVSALPGHAPPATANSCTPHTQITRQTSHRRREQRFGEIALATNLPLRRIPSRRLPLRRPCGHAPSPRIPRMAYTHPRRALAGP